MEREEAYAIALKLLEGRLHDLDETVKRIEHAEPGAWLRVNGPRVAIYRTDARRYRAAFAILVREAADTPVKEGGR